MQNNQQLAGAILLAGVIIAGAILLKDSDSSLTPPAVNRAVADIQVRAVSIEEHLRGKADAKIIIIEYSDTECPFCKVFQGTLQDIVSANKEVAWVYRHYPIPKLHQKAFREAMATECAWEQGGNDIFWIYLDEVFARTTSNDSLDPAELPKIAGDMGLDVPVFNACLESGKFRQKIEKDMEDGQLAGVTGTPHSVFILKKDISPKQQAAIIRVLPKPEYVSFDPEKKNLLGLSGAMPEKMIEKIIEIFLSL